MSPFVWICTISDSSSILEFYFSLTVDTEPVEMNRMTSNQISFFKSFRSDFPFLNIKNNLNCDMVITFCRHFSYILQISVESHQDVACKCKFSIEGNELQIIKIQYNSRYHFQTIH